MAYGMMQKVLDFHTNLARQTATTSNLARLLGFILDQTLDLSGAQTGSIMVHDPKARRLHLHFSTGHPSGRKRLKEIPASLPADVGIAGRVLQTGKAIFVDETTRADPTLPLRKRTAGGSFLSIPLKIQRRTIGVLNLNRPATHPPFLQEDLALISTILPHIAGLVEKARLVQQLEASRNEVKSLYQLSRLLFSGSEFGPSLRRFLKELARHLGLERAAVIRFRSGNLPVPSSEEPGPTFDLLAGVGVTGAGLQRMLLAVHSRMRSDLARPGPNEWDDSPERPPVAFPYQEGPSRKNMFVIPLPLSEDRIHALLVSAPRRTPDSETAIHQYRFLHLVSKQLAVAIERETMVSRIKADQEILMENNLRQEIFLNISKELASTLDPTLILRKAFDHFGKLIPFTSISILLYDELEKTYRILVQPGEPLSPRFQARMREEILGTFRDFPADPPLEDFSKVSLEMLHPQRKRATPRGSYRFAQTVPLIVGEKIVGTIHMTRNEGGPFAGKEFDITTQFTGIFVTSIKNALIHRRTEKLAFTDPLTGLYNHRYFQETLKTEFLRARRYSNPLSLMILDIDYFKRFNDTWGHLLGDRVLVHCGRLFERSVREKIDTVARYGGEEFAVLLPETPFAGSSVFAERIRKAVEETPLDSESGLLPITLSIGLACTAVTNCQNPSDLIQAADTALYAAKESGRNQVRLYEKEQVEHA